MLSSRDIERIGRETLREFYTLRNQGKLSSIKSTFTAEQINRVYQRTLEDLGWRR